MGERMLVLAEVLQVSVRSDLVHAVNIVQAQEGLSVGSQSEQPRRLAIS
jgi:hypothetical protein